MSILPVKKSKHQRGTAAPRQAITDTPKKEDADGSAPSKTKTNPKQCFTKKIELGFAQYGGPGGIDKCTSFLPKSQGGNADFVCKRRTYPATYEFIL